ncbi:MAG: DUF86 domain-containing protein [Anaerolineales bacterium]|nr:DUF86 domain-containing protein [Anaerolineales bacterium]
MLENAQLAIGFVKGMDYDAFSKDNKTVYAVIRAVEVIGEAATNVPDEIRSKHPSLPWRDIRGMRNKLVHQYFGINMEVVWKTILEDLPMIVGEIEKILKNENK